MRLAHISRRAIRAAALMAATLCAMPAPVTAQSYPDRPIRLVVPFPPGGSSDVSARLLAQQLGERLGRPIVTENRPGAGTMIGNEIVMRAPADGYTLLYAASSITITPNINPSLRFDPRRDLAAISLYIDAPLVLVANTAVPFQSLTGLVDYAKANPGRLNIAYPGMGTTNHLAAALLNHRAGLDIVLVPFAGNAAGLTALMRNDVQLAVDSLASATGFIREGQIRALGVTGEQRAASLPDVPAIAEALPGFETTFWFGLMAPAGTPQPIIDRLSAETMAAVREPTVVTRLHDLGIEARADGPAAFAARIERDFTKWGELVRAANIRID
jgi:tripartite-type tricarboxylate transporter receptor subunit TctC